MSLWQKIKNSFDPHYGKVQCDICGDWGESNPNPNYEGCDGKAFVHIRASGARFVHPQHIIKSYFAKRNKYKIEYTSISPAQSIVKVQEIPKLILGGDRVFLEEE